MKVCLFWRGDDRHVECLSILLHHECLYVLAKDSFSIRIILFVFVEHDLLAVREVVFVFVRLVNLQKLLAVPR